ncbi:MULTISPECIES: hypothetical protein [unclassified Aureimonas]|uniref:hypothetical protein n=1 Tax=unclassified Aureimonas TaxID=2615206 RepID=UPI0012E3F080|nr:MULTISPECIES: hypothetical protein [unclassified Aureimonas]
MAKAVLNDGASTAVQEVRDPTVAYDGTQMPQTDFDRTAHEPFTLVCYRRPMSNIHKFEPRKPKPAPAKPKRDTAKRNALVVIIGVAVLVVASMLLSSFGTEM